MLWKNCTVVLCLLLLSACNSRDANTSTANTGAGPGATNSSSPANATPAANAVKANIDVCGLLTADDLKNVQGEAYKDAMRSDRQDGDFIVAQCYYSLPTTTNSVVLNVTTAKSGADAQSPRSLWEATFGKDEGGEKSAKRDKDKEVEKREERSEEKEQEAKPEKISGLGDEAFWLASRVGGALYVLKKEQFFRISVGGAADEKTKLSKSKALAQQVLKRL